MSANSNLRVIALVASLLAPSIGFAQSGVNSGAVSGGAAGSNQGAAGNPAPLGAGTGVDTNSVPPARNSAAPSAGTGTIPPAVNDNLTWDYGRQRPNTTRQVYRIYSRPKSALTRFDVHPFDSFAKQCYILDKPMRDLSVVGRRGYVCE